MTEIVQEPERLTLDQYVALYDPQMASSARRIWAEKFGRSGRPFVDSGRVRRDLSQLQKTSGEVRAYVDKHVAHYDRKPLPVLPTFNDLNRSVNYLGRLLRRYRLLLTATSLLRVTPIPQYDVLAIFRQPWLPAPMNVRRRQEP